VNKIRSILLGGAVAVAAMGTAGAAPVTVGGVTWDPDYLLDFASSSVQMHQIFEGDGSVRGYGVISTINGRSQSQFCDACELTLVFRDYRPTSTVGNTVLYSGGVVEIYMNTGESSINPNDPLTVNDNNVGRGDLWLSLAGYEYNGATLRGTVYSQRPPNLSGLGQLEVVGGIAARYFDTNLQVGGADLAFSASFTQPYPGQPNHVIGTGNFYGVSAVPEPSAYLMLGAGLLALTQLRRRKA
jgi:PEP-CTERM motif